MRRFVAVLFLLLCSTLVHATDKPTAADYTIKVHVLAMHVRWECDAGRCRSVLYVDTILNGKKFELSGDAVNIKNRVLFSPGDYPVRLRKDNSSPDSTLFSQEYDLLLPDGTVWHCWTSGISE